eukprot:TRINITY_DN5639_c0_g1_i4.p1 TRINITY_DN5639_c0_g1~~TRINITY_DN5639_c0_g1_i4.p1  ORF type:complete len:776 (-),score=196.29 TRINITY_DN5639_c0_g1_i4:265-2592(-)
MALSAAKARLAPCTNLGSHVPVSGGLKVHPALMKVVEEIVCKDTGFSTDYFWASLSKLVEELSPELDRCLAKRDEIQAKIDGFYEGQKQAGVDLKDAAQLASQQKFLREIGYIAPDMGAVSIATPFVDDEIASVPAPQLVVPSDNARFALNAVNARWGSLFDALYGFDVIPSTKMQQEAKSSGYNTLRGDEVVEFANGLLDEIFPLETGKWADVTRLWPRFVGSWQQLDVLLKSGESTNLAQPSLFVGSSGSLGPPAGYNQGLLAEVRKTTPRVPDKGRIILKHNGLHVILDIDRSHPVGERSSHGIKDIIMESALSAILDMEDSVAVVDAEDKARVYTNVGGILRGTLEAPFLKDGKAVVRKMNDDIWFRDQRGARQMLPGKVVALTRNVGHHMFTDAVVTADDKPIPEGFLDCLVTVTCSLGDLRGEATRSNSQTGSIYIVKPKMHGPQEVALTGMLFTRAEEFFGLRKSTIKMGIMDEERRTSANLRECLRAAADRVFFINTGFLDRTGDEIHTCLRAGPVVRKKDMKQTSWIKAYEQNNVDIGLFSGLVGKGQIGKGMWAKPDSMRAMLTEKIGEMKQGASTAWVPSPVAATLHSIHYHRVDVMARQAQLAMREPAKMQSLLEPPLLQKALSREEIETELKECAQAILGYVVRWIDLGVGCSKVPDLSNVGLMEDRATLRISSQLLANWLHHGLITKDDVHAAFSDMAKVVDTQNANDRAYRPMSGNLETSLGYQAALKLVFDGRDVNNGYTEYTLHEFRRQAKAATMSRL